MKKAKPLTFVNWSENEILEREQYNEEAGAKGNFLIFRV